MMYKTNSRRAQNNVKNAFQNFNTHFKVAQWIIAAIFFIIISVFVVTMLYAVASPNISISPTGMTELKCEGGYKFLVHSNANFTNVTQVLDSFGKGVPCN